MLALLATGQSDKEIARVLGVTLSTVKHTNSALYKRLGIRCRAQAAVWWVRAADGAETRGESLGAEFFRR